MRWPARTSLCWTLLAACSSGDPASASFHRSIAVVPVGSHPYGIAITPDGSRVYVTDHGSGLHLDSVSVLETAGNTAFASIALGATAAPTGIAITADGTRAYLLAGDGRILVVDISPTSATYHHIIGQLPRPLQQGCIAITPDGSRALIDWSGTQRRVEVLGIDPLQTTYHQVLATPVANGSPGDLCNTPDSRFAFASDGGGELCRIDLQLGSIDRNSSVAAGAMALVPGRPLLLDATAQTLDLVSTTELSRVVRLAAPWPTIAAHGLVVTPDGSRVYATCRDGAGTTPWRCCSSRIEIA